MNFKESFLDGAVEFEKLKEYQCYSFFENTSELKRNLGFDDDEYSLFLGEQYDQLKSLLKIEKEKFGTKGSRKKLEDERHKWAISFCPLIKAKCRNDCVCFYEGDLVKKTVDGVERLCVVNPGCNNVLIDGYIRFDI